MTEKIPLTKLNGPKIYSCVAKGTLTLQQLAECYDCSYEQFLAECKRKVSPFEWKRILKANERNQKLSRQRGKAEKMTTTQTKLAEERKKKALQEELAIVREKAIISKSVTRDFEGRYAKAQKEEEQARLDWEQAQKRLAWTEQNLKESQEADARYEERIRQLQDKLDKFNTYLVAPGYKGKMPKGKMISVIPFEGYEVTVEEGDDLLNDVSFASMLEMGFETLKEANTALEFAKLVLKYQLEFEGKFKILVDDEKIITILRGQEVEI